MRRRATEPAAPPSVTFARSTPETREVPVTETDPTLLGEVQLGQHPLDVACVLLNVGGNPADSRTWVFSKAPDLVHVPLIDGE